MASKRAHGQAGKPSTERQLSDSDADTSEEGREEAPGKTKAGSMEKRLSSLEASIERIARAVDRQGRMTAELWGKPSGRASRGRKSTITAEEREGQGRQMVLVRVPL